MAIGCRIRVTADGEAIRIEAVATSREDVNGRYRFNIQKISASGTSLNTQSGNFNLEANREEVLSTTLLGASDADHFQARLMLDSIRECLMRFALRNDFSAIAFTAVVAATSAQPAFADSAFVTQAVRVRSPADP